MHDPLDPAFDAAVDAALARKPEVRVPEHFRQRLLTRLPDPVSAPEPRLRPWVLPALGIAGAATVAALGIAALELGFADALGGSVRELSRPGFVLTLVGLEAAASIAWAWRALTR